MVKLAILGTAHAAREVLEALMDKGKVWQVDVFVVRAQTGEVIDCIDKVYKVGNIEEAEPKNYEAAVFVGDETLAKNYAHHWAKSGVKIVNATDALSDYAEIPYAAYDDNDWKGHNIVNVPHQFSLQIIRAISALRGYGIKNVHLTACIGADIAGQDGMSELYNHTRRILMNDEPSDKKVFPKTLAFNVIPQAGAFIGEETEYEWQIGVDIKRIFGNKVKVHANCAIVPAFVGMGAFVSVECNKEITPEQARDVWQKDKGILVADTQKDGGYAALTDAQGEREVFVSRIRQSGISDKEISFWTAGDNMKIFATAIVDIAIKMLKKEMK